MAVRKYPPIAREGWVAIFLALVASLVLTHEFGWWSVPLWGATGTLVYLFRDPSREVPAAPLGVLSPADGYVVSVDEVTDRYLDRQALCISLDMRFSGIYSIRGPVEGKLVQEWRMPAEKGLAAREQALWLKTDEGDDIVTVMRPGRWSGRSACYYHSGERIGQGMRCGFLLFGSRIDVLLPTRCRVLVKPGDGVLSGTSIIAELVHRR